MLRILGRSGRSDYLFIGPSAVNEGLRNPRVISELTRLNQRSPLESAKSQIKFCPQYGIFRSADTTARLQ